MDFKFKISTINTEKINLQKSMPWNISVSKNYIPYNAPQRGIVDVEKTNQVATRIVILKILFLLQYLK